MTTTQQAKLDNYFNGFKGMDWIPSGTKVPFKATTLMDYLAAKRPSLKIEVYGTTVTKERNLSSGIAYTRGSYDGKRIIVKKNKEVIFDHNTAETYRTNKEIVSFIAHQLGLISYAL